MPISIDKVNVIIPKEKIDSKYFGGRTQFEKDFIYTEDKANSQDRDLYNIALMNLDTSIIDFLMERGLHFDTSAKFSSDFTIFDRYGGFYWMLDEVEEIDGVFLIHKNANKAEYDRAIEISQMGVDVLFDEKTENYRLLHTFQIDHPIEKKRSWFQKIKAIFLKSKNSHQILH